MVHKRTDWRRFIGILAVGIVALYALYWVWTFLGFAERKEVSRAFEVVVSRIESTHPQIAAGNTKTAVLPGVAAGCEFWTFEALWRQCTAVLVSSDSQPGPWLAAIEAALNDPCEVLARNDKTSAEARGYFGCDGARRSFKVVLLVEKHERATSTAGGASYQKKLI